MVQYITIDLRQTVRGSVAYLSLSPRAQQVVSFILFGPKSDLDDGKFGAAVDDLALALGLSAREINDVLGELERAGFHRPGGPMPDA